MKHAFLIAAHQDIEQLYRLIVALDSENSLFYVHWDKKQEQVLKQSSLFRNLQKKNNVYFVESIKVYWGGLSQVLATIKLLKAAIQSEAVYFHYLSGLDYPLKSLSYIWDFFDNNHHNYLTYISEESCYEYFVNRYYFYDTDYMDVCGKIKYKRKVMYNLLLILQRCTYLLVQKLGIQIRKKMPFKYYHGSNWFSFTRDAVEYILTRISEDSWILKRFKYTAVCDESFFTMLVMDNSKLKETVINDDLRLRMPDGKLNRSGYVCTEKDFERIRNSSALFGRKFCSGISDNLIDRINTELL